MDWIIVQNTGDRADLQSDWHRKEVRRPPKMSRKQFIDGLQSGMGIDDVTLQLFYGDKQPAQVTQPRSKRPDRKKGKV